MEEMSARISHKKGNNNEFRMPKVVKYLHRCHTAMYMQDIERLTTFSKLFTCHVIIFFVQFNAHVAIHFERNRKRVRERQWYSPARKPTVCKFVLFWGAGHPKVGPDKPQTFLP